VRVVTHKATQNKYALKVGRVVEVAAAGMEIKKSSPCDESEGQLGGGS